MSLAAQKRMREMADGMEGFFAEGLRHPILTKSRVRRLINTVQKPRGFRASWVLCLTTLRWDQRLSLVLILKKWQREAARAREKVVRHNLRLVQKEVRRQASRHMLQHLRESDLFQEGVTGLLTAIDKFDVTQDVEFSTYATYWVKQRIRRAIHDQDRTIRIPVHRIEVGVRLYNVKQELESELDREPEESEIAERYEKKYPNAHKMMRPINFDALPPHTLSLDAPAARQGRGSAEREVTLLDLQEDPNDGPEEETDEGEGWRMAEALLDALDARSADVVRMRLGLDPYDRVHTLEEVANKWQITRERTRQIQMASYKRLKELIGPSKEEQEAQPHLFKSELVLNGNYDPRPKG